MDILFSLIAPCRVEEDDTTRNADESDNEEVCIVMPNLVLHVSKCVHSVFNQTSFDILLKY